MATYRARLSPQSDGSWIASAVALPHCWSRGETRDEALTRLRDEIRYRIELCPCSGVDDEYVQVDLEVAGAGVQPSSRGSAPASPASDQAPAVSAPLSGVLGCPPEPERQANARALGAPPSAADPTPSATQRRRGWRRWDD